MPKVRLIRGRWCADWRDDAGRRFIRRFADKSAANQYLGEIEKKLERGAFKAPDTLPKFETVCAEWLAEHEASIATATAVGYEDHIYLHLVPALGHHRIDRIHPRHIQNFSRERRETLQPQTISNLLRTATAIFKYAVRQQYIDTNPAAVVERPKRVVSAESVADLANLPLAGAESAVDPSGVLSNAQARQVIAKAPPGIHQTYLLTALLTG